MIRQNLELATKAAISLPLVCWIAFAGAVLAASGYLAEPSAIPLAAVAGAVTMLLVFAVLYVVERLLLRRLEGLAQIVAGLLAYALLGAARGAGLTVLLDWLLTDELTAVSLGYRMAANISWMLLFLSFGSYIVTISRQQRAESTALQRQEVQIEQTLQQIESASQNDNELAIQEIESRIRDEVAAIQLPQRATHSDALEALTDRVIRPLSQELASRIPDYTLPTTDLKKLPWWKFWTQSQIGSNIRPVISVATCIGAWVAPLAFTLHPLTAPVACAVGVAIWLPLLFAVRALLRWLSDRARPGPLLLLTIVAIPIAIIPALAVAAYLTPGLEQRHDILAAGLIQSSENVLFVAVALTIIDQQKVAALAMSATRAELTWLQTRARLIQWHHHGELARTLHGPVQSEILVAMHSADLAANSADDSVERVANQLTDRLSDLLTREGTANVAELIEGSAEFWDSQSRISYQMGTATESTLAADPACADLTSSILEDAIANAIRHGDASRIWISLYLPSAKELTIRVEDNGVPTPAESGTGLGLGTAQLTACTLQWSRSNTPDGTTLMATLPIEALT